MISGLEKLQDSSQIINIKLTILLAFYSVPSPPLKTLLGSPLMSASRGWGGEASL